MRIHLFVLASLGSLSVTGGSATLPPVQTTAVVEQPLRAVGPDAARRQSSPPVAETSYYADVIPAQSGDIGIDHVDPVPGYQFSAVKLVMSVAPGLYAAGQDITGAQATGGLGTLRHLSAHVSVRPLDGGGQPVEVKRGGPIVLATLEISPSEPSYGDRISNRQAAIGTAVSEVASEIRPAAGIYQAFQAAFHRRPPVTQVAYMTGPNAFGWRWYESPDATIEGLHFGTALLQVADAVKSVRITIEFVADWRAFGPWAKTFEFTYAVPRPPGS